MARSNENYADLLRDSRWQRKRLEVMDRAGFECEWCRSRSTLNVHHSFYTKDAAPWEYPDESLHCLCEPCHHRFQRVYDELKKGFGYCELRDLDLLHGFIFGIGLGNGRVVWTAARTAEFVDGIARAIGLASAEVAAARDGNFVLTVEALERAASRLIGPDPDYQI